MHFYVLFSFDPSFSHLFLHKLLRFCRGLEFSINMKTDMFPLTYPSPHYFYIISCSFIPIHYIGLIHMKIIVIVVLGYLLI